MNTSFEVHQRVSAPTDLRFKLNQIRSRTITPHEDPESHRAGLTRKWTRRHHIPTCKRKENTSPTTTKIKDDSGFTPLKLSIDQILHIIKHQSWVRLSKPSKHDTDLLEAGHCSFYGSQGYPSLYCWALKRHLEDLILCGYLEEFILDLEEDPEVRDTPAESTN